MQRKLFVYGSLLFPEIQFKLLKKYPSSIPAFLKSYVTVCLSYGSHTSSYPVLKYSDGSSVEGFVLSGLDESDISKIKFYEGEEYCLQTVPVSVEGTNEMISTFMRNPDINIEYGPAWDKDSFRRNHLSEYVQNTIPQVLDEYKDSNTELSPGRNK